MNITPDESVRLPTEHGEFVLNLYIDPIDGKEHMALVMGDVGSITSPLTRIHSECFTGDVLGSTRCDCGFQLNHALDSIAKEEVGVLLYLRQEGRGIGLAEKLKAYALQDKGYDTVQANVMLGHKPDERDYSLAGKILKSLGVTSVKLITNNPDKLESLEAQGITVAERVSSPLAVYAENHSYLATKASKLRHLFDSKSLIPSH